MRTRRRPRRGWTKALIGATALLAAALFGTGRLVAYFDRAVWGDANTKRILVPKGMGAIAAGELLERNRVISSARLWRLALRWHWARAPVQPGEYEFIGPTTPAEILARLQRGDVKLYRVTIPEGLRCDEVMSVFARSELALDGPALQRLCTDAELAHAEGLEADRLEGYLFPTTYAFARGATGRDIVHAMVARALQVYDKTEEQRAPEVTLSRHEAFTLASIIEKETALPEERTRVSCLFHNRLRQRMRLETDPTVLYGQFVATGHYDTRLAFHGFTAARSEPGPYNTYLKSGLPAGPINNPSSESLAAALHPASCDDLYFVANGKGGHTFCRDLKCHQDAVRAYVKRRRKKR